MLELGVCYYPEQWSQSRWREDAKQMVALGLDWIRIAEFSWAQVELERGVFDWEWLDEAIEVLGSAGLKIAMCTPSAAPPKWLVDEHPEILPVDASGQVRNFGARRHYCFASNRYREEACRIATEYARRYGESSYIKAWQIDNEYGDHETIYSYSDEARRAFRQWLSEKYNNIDALNTEWHSEFWGTRYSSFDAVDLPGNLVAEANPAHDMAFARFFSDRVAKFNKAQVEVVRQHSPGRPVTHNFMANSFDFDHYDVAADLDFASWDSYPLGNLIHGHLPDEQKAHWIRSGDPDYQAFHSDLYRSVGKGKVWITEQQPGPVNWADYNQSPDDGMIRLWTWQAYAHGVDTVCYFRWRQAPFAQEQFHTALLLSDGSPDQAYHEVAQVANERQSLPNDSKRTSASVAIVMDYPSRWSRRILPQGRNALCADVTGDWYRMLSSIGIDVDFVSPQDHFDGYKLVLIPDMMVGDPEMVSRLSRSSVKVVLGPRSGSKTAIMQTPDNLPPGAFGQMIDCRVIRVESLPPYHQETVTFEGQSFEVSGWRESIETGEEVIGRFSGHYRTDWPAITGNNRCRYIATMPQGEFLHRFLASCAQWAGIQPTEPRPDLRITRRGLLNFAFNFGPETQTIPDTANARFLLGQSALEPTDVAVWLAAKEDC